jgi:hypothetical protein
VRRHAWPVRQGKTKPSASGGDSALPEQPKQHPDTEEVTGSIAVPPTDLPGKNLREPRLGTRGQETIGHLSGAAHGTPDCFEPSLFGPISAKSADLLIVCGHA